MFVGMSVISMFEVVFLVANICIQIKKIGKYVQEKLSGEDLNESIEQKIVDDEETTLESLKESIWVSYTISTDPISKVIMRHKHNDAKLCNNVI